MASDDHVALECVKLTPAWKEPLAKFLHLLKESGDEEFFHPHESTDDVLNQLASDAGKDLYYLLTEGRHVLGYGLLRGWNEGYVVPSLGIAIHPAVRGGELGKLLMQFLHAAAFRRGATKVRLRVLRSNEKALRLYTSFGYAFESNWDQDDYLIGFKTLTG